MLISAPQHNTNNSVNREYQGSLQIREKTALIQKRLSFLTLSWDVFEHKLKINMLYPNVFLWVTPCLELDTQTAHSADPPPLWWQTLPLCTVEALFQSHPTHQPDKKQEMYCIKGYSVCTHTSLSPLCVVGSDLITQKKTKRVFLSAVVNL